MTAEEVARIERNLGRLVMGLPAIAASLGHSTVQDSLPYLHADPDRPEQGLLFAMLDGMPVHELCERYFGGVGEAVGAFTAHATAHASRKAARVQG